MQRRRRRVPRHRLPGSQRSGFQEASEVRILSVSACLFTLCVCRLVCIFCVSVGLSVYVWVSVGLSVCVCVFVGLSVYVYVSVDLSVYVSVSVGLSVYVCVSVGLSVYFVCLLRALCMLACMYSVSAYVYRISTIQTPGGFRGLYNYLLRRLARTLRLSVYLNGISTIQTRGSILVSTSPVGLSVGYTLSVCLPVPCTPVRLYSSFMWIGSDPSRFQEASRSVRCLSACLYTLCVWLPVLCMLVCILFV